MTDTPRDLYAIDLVADESARPLWRPHRSSAPAEGGDDLSPMGFRWSSTAEAGARRISFDDSMAVPAPTRRGFGRPTQSARLKTGDGELSLTVWDVGARVVASPESWAALREPALLAIAQYWRFQSIDAELDLLTRRSEADVAHASMSGLATFRDKARLLAHARRVRRIFLDLPHFAGPLTDPYAFFDSEKQASAYASISEKLHFEEWAESIDERAEAVEDTYASVTEKLTEYRNYLGGSTLEIIIIVILVIEVAFNILQYLQGIEA